jgi:hypothetical protein
MNLSRRNFFTKSAVGAAALASIPSIISASIPSKSEQTKQKYTLFGNGNTILFQGDSITDAGRDKEKELPNIARSFGLGYAFLHGFGTVEGLTREKPHHYITGVSVETKFIS